MSEKSEHSRITSYQDQTAEDELVELRQQRIWDQARIRILSRALGDLDRFDDVKDEIYWLNQEAEQGRAMWADERNDLIAQVADLTQQLADAQAKAALADRLQRHARLYMRYVFSRLALKKDEAEGYQQATQPLLEDLARYDALSSSSTVTDTSGAK